MPIEGPQGPESIEKESVPTQKDFDVLFRQLAHFNGINGRDWKKIKVEGIPEEDRAKAFEELERLRDRVKSGELVPRRSKRAFQRWLRKYFSTEAGAAEETSETGDGEAADEYATEEELAAVADAINGILEANGEAVDSDEAIRKEQVYSAEDVIEITYDEAIQFLSEKASGFRDWNIDDWQKLVDELPDDLREVAENGLSRIVGFYKTQRNEYRGHLKFPVHFDKDLLIKPLESLQDSIESVLRRRSGAVNEEDFNRRKAEESVKKEKREIFEDLDRELNWGMDKKFTRLDKKLKQYERGELLLYKLLENMNRDSVDETTVGDRTYSYEELEGLFYKTQEHINRLRKHLGYTESKSPPGFARGVIPEMVKEGDGHDTPQPPDELPGVEESGEERQAETRDSAPEVVSISPEEVGSEIRRLLEDFVAVHDVEVKGSGEVIDIVASFNHKLAGNCTIEISMGNDRGSASVRSVNVVKAGLGGFATKGLVEGAIKSFLPELPNRLRAFLEEKYDRPIDNIAVREGALQVRFEVEDTPVVIDQASEPAAEPVEAADEAETQGEEPQTLEELFQGISDEARSALEESGISIDAGGRMRIKNPNAQGIPGRYLRSDEYDRVRALIVQANDGDGPDVLRSEVVSILGVEDVAQPEPGPRVGAISERALQALQELQDQADAEESDQQEQGQERAKRRRMHIPSMRDVVVGSLIVGAGVAVGTLVKRWWNRRKSK